MASKTLTINLKVNATQADQATKRSVDGLKAVEAAAEKAVKAQATLADKAVAQAEKKAASLSALEDSYLKRDYDRRVAYEQKKERAGEAAAAKAIATAQREADRKSAAAERAIDKMIAGVAKHDAQWTKQYTKEEAYRRALNEKTRRQNDEMVNAELKAMGITDRRFKNGWEGAGKVMTGVIGIASAFGLVTSASGAISALASEFEKINKSAIEGAKFTTEYRNSILELAALKGHIGDTGKETKESISFRSKTLQSLEQSTAFQGAALGVGQSAIDDPRTGRKGNITQEEFNKAMVSGGAFQAAEGGSADTHGALTGMLPSLMGKRVNAAEVSAKRDQLYEIFQPGGASFTSLTTGYMKNAPIAKSGVVSPERLAAIESAMSVADKEGHADKTQQFIRATSGGMGKLKGPKMEGEDLEKIGPYLKRLGVTEDMDPIQIGKLISSDLDKQQKAGRNLKMYLGEKGYGNQEEVNALLQFHGMQSKGEFKAFEDLAAGKGVIGGADAKVKAFQGADPLAQTRKANLAGEAGKMKEGLGKTEYFQALMKETFNAMKIEGKTDSMGFPLSGEWEDIATAGPMNVMATDRQGLVYNEARKRLSTEAKRVGINKVGDGKGRVGDVDKMGPVYSPATGQIPTSSQQASWLYGEAEMVGKAGGSVMPGFEQTMSKFDQLIDATNKTTEAIAKGQAKEAAAPLPVGIGVGGGMAR